MSQHTIDLPCIADTYIDENNPNTNYGSATILKLEGDSYKRRMLLNFDISNLPIRKGIISVSLRLYLTNNFDFLNDGELYITPLEDIVDREYTITYNTWTTFSNIITTISREWLSGGNYGSFSLPTYYVYSGLMLIGGNYLPEMQCHSRENTNPPILQIVYNDVPPSKPTLNEPIGSYKVNSEVIRLSWNYISSVGGTQKGFNLQYSTDQSTWTTVSQTTANNYYDAPAGTFTAGNIYWRVQTINEYDETSAYSDIVAFYAIGAPETPVIQSVPNSAKPTITWASSSQQVYQVQLSQGETTLHDSGVLPGMETRLYKLPVYLANGDYTAKVRIKNEYDMYSEWGIADFTLSVVPPDKPTLSAQKTILGIELHIINNADKTLIYRDNVCIASITGDVFTDYSAAHGIEYEYFVRAVNESEAFNDSDSVFIRPVLKNNLFAPVSDIGDIIRLKYNKNTIPAKTVTLIPISTATYYSGRNHAVTEFSEHEESVMMFSFFVKDLAIIKKFKDLIRSKETVLFRDARGRKIYGTLSGWNEIDDRSGHQIGFTLTEADYDEEVIE